MIKNFVAVFGFVLLVLPVFQVRSQVPAGVPEINMRIAAANREINNLTYSGYETRFTGQVETIQYAWWKYARKVGIVENMKAYYLLKIPATQKGKSSVPVIQTAETAEGGTLLFMALMDQTDNELKTQVQALLLEFKTSYYTEQVDKAVAGKERELAEITEKYQAATDNGKNNNRQFLEKILETSAELEQLKQQYVLLSK